MTFYRSYFFLIKHTRCCEELSGGLKRTRSLLSALIKQTTHEKMRARVSHVCGSIFLFLNFCYFFFKKKVKESRLETAH